MVRVVIVAVLMLSTAVVLTAQDDGLSREELQHRRAQLNAQAEQIKRATRFQGRISVSPEMNKISRIEGRFENITFPAMDDTLGIERTFDEIVHRIISFFPVNREDLERVNLGIREHRTGVTYKQTANGYEIEGASRLRISYSYIDKRVLIVNSLAYLDPSVLPTEPRITKEEAEGIFYENVGKVDMPENMVDNEWFARLYRPSFKLMYCYRRISPDSGYFTTPKEYRLAWKTVTSEREFIIDASTGEIMLNVSAVYYNQHPVKVEGIVYPESDDTGLLEDSLEVFKKAESEAGE